MLNITTTNNQELKDYAEAIAQQIEGADVNQVEKANGVILTAVAVPTSATVKANCYVDQFYKDGLTVTEATNKIKDIMNGQHPTDFNISFFEDFEQVKPMLRAHLYNEATNADVYKRAEAPFDDLVIVPYVTGIRINGQNGVIRVRAEHLKLWNVTADEVIAIAEENSRDDFEIVDMADMFPVLCERDMMFIVSTEAKTNGAYAIIPALDTLKERFGAFTVLPSSVHEVIVVPTIKQQDEMSDIVNEVNDTQVNPDEQLSNHAYIIA